MHVGIYVEWEIVKARSTIIVILAWIFCFYHPSFSWAQTLETRTADNVSPLPQPPIPPRGALFKIQDAGHTLYLFGTIHVGTHDFYPLEPRVMQALEQASTIALEIDPGKSQALQQALAQYAFYPPGQSYQNALSPHLQQQVQQILKRYDIAPADVARFRPWLLATILTVHEFSSNGYQSKDGVDGYLANYAKQHNKTVIELENAEKQTALFGTLSINEQVALLQDTIDEITNPNTARKVIEIAELWRKADVAGFEKLNEEMEKDKSFAGRFARGPLLEQRNPGLAQGIISLLRKQDHAFAAIGILHLTGPVNVPSLLQQQGCYVERIY